MLVRLQILFGLIIITMISMHTYTHIVLESWWKQVLGVWLILGRGLTTDWLGTHLPKLLVHLLHLLVLLILWWVLGLWDWCLTGWELLVW